MSRGINGHNKKRPATQKFGWRQIFQIRRIMALRYIIYVKICIFQLFFQKKLPGTNIMASSTFSHPFFSREVTRRGLRPQPKKGRRVEGKKKQKKMSQNFLSQKYPYNLVSSFRTKYSYQKNKKLIHSITEVTEHSSLTLLTSLNRNLARINWKVKDQIVSFLVLFTHC